MANTVIAIEITVPGGTKSLSTLDEVNEALQDVREQIGKLKSTDADFDNVSRNFVSLTNTAKQFRLETQTSGQKVKDSFKAIEAEIRKLTNQYQSLSEVDRRSDVGLGILKNITNLRQELAKIDGELKGTLQKQQFPIGSYRAMSAELVRLRNEYKNLSDGVRNSPVGANIANQANVLAKNLQDLDKKLGLYQRNVGNYRSAIGSVANILTFGIATGGLAAGVQLFDQAIRVALNNTINFSRQISTIQAVSGATKAELAQVEAEILKVGNSSEFTSQEIAQLAIEYAKLGFSTSEIIDVLAATTDVATLAGEDLASTAAAIGAVLNIFELDTKDAALAGDILAGAFNRTALGLRSFETGISIVGPAANAVGIDLKTTTALLGILADNSIDASTAGTALRNIFIETANSGRSLQEAFDLINESQNKVAVANALFGKDASVVALTLAKQQDEVVSLISELDNVAGASKSAADVMREDLKGSFDELTGAAETFGITLISANESSIKNFVKGIADLIRFFTNLLQGQDEAVKKFTQVRNVIATLIPVIGAFTLAVTLNSRATAFNAGTAIGKWIASILRLTGITRIITIAQYAWNLALTLNPIGIVITAVGALVTAISFAYTSTSGFAKLLRKVFEFAADLGKKLLLIFNPAAYLGTFILGEKLLAKANKKTQEDVTKDNAAELAKRQAQNDAYLKENKDKLNRFGLFVGDVGKGINKNFKIDSNALGKSAEEARETLETKLAPKDALAFDKFDLENLRNRAAFRFGNRGEKETVDELDKLVTKQKELEVAIKNSIVTGKPYADLLTQYNEITLQINKAEKEWEDQLEKIDNAVTAAAGSVEFYQQEVSKLKKELENAPSDGITKIIGDLDQAEKNLKTAETSIKRLQRAASNSSFTPVLESDITPLEEEIKQRRELAEEEAERTIRDSEVLEKTRTIIALTADIQIWEARKALYTEGSKELLDIEKKIAGLREKLGSVDQSRNQAALIAAIELQANQEVLKVKEKDYEDYVDKIEDIEAQKNIAILKLKLQNSELDYQTRLNLEIKLADEIAKLEDKNKKKKNDTFNLNSETEEALAFVDLTLTELSNLGSAVDDLIKTQQENRIKELERYYDKEIEAAQGNKDVITRLEKEKAAKIDALKREQFEKNKKIELAQASIAYAQGIINILTASSVIKQPFDAIYKGIQLAFLAGQYALQVSAIRARTYAEGGYTVPIGNKDHTGYRVAGVVHEDEYVIPKHVLDTPAGAALAARAENLRLKKATPNYYSYATGGFVLPVSQNDSVATQRPTVFKVTIEDDQMDRFATMVAEEVAGSVAEAVIEGYREIAVETTRRKNLQTITG